MMCSDVTVNCLFLSLFVPTVQPFQGFKVSPHHPLLYMLWPSLFYVPSRQSLQLILPVHCISIQIQKQKCLEIVTPIFHSFYNSFVARNLLINRQ